MDSQNVLLISYLFPPVGGAGVQRNLKYVKYLPYYGWRPIVLTVKNIAYYAYDESLLAEVPPEALVVRAGSLDPLRVAAVISGLRRRFVGPKLCARSIPATETSTALQLYRKGRDFLTFPDAQAPWIPFAYYRGLQLIKENKISVIMASIGPLSSAVVASLLARKTGLPYLLDFRDGWMDNPYFRIPTVLHRRAHSMLERYTVAPADAIGVYDECLGRALKTRYVSLSQKIYDLPNGFDAEDAEGIRPMLRTLASRIVYSGSLYEHHRPNLTSFLAALCRLPDDFIQSLEVLFVGSMYAGAREEISAAGLGSIVHCLGYLPHAEALAYLHSADAALLFIRADDVTSITGKVFEYLLTCRPILACIDPNGACADLLRRTGHGEWLAPPDDASEIADKILAMARMGWPRSHKSAAEQYTRKHITGRLASVLDSIVPARDQVRRKL
jgi:glycosyltransferase involved in cell wall biosynthesis